ncbi:YggS family pyridoxal phosphate-dependent enzyme [Microbispora bryophytorum]|uniref:Pyridoxal phosphate homeostasis protein n=1 Tax=Microbispora bryophytorum TaxID=1460882 RepID=A0A8H9GZ47_9ACTN|nr:YggS family pyridoxal phosphate-dependent enzyme [Microbispora bryophytorum]MBD3134811.1 YggS family pyridoxal phosphate-dependent enzyme [Microbispora bryophytorum]TQS08927.1 YggS family pyridoxal phosphate-dependent enzyme [Microbispora bryophytorum]GGO12137.1 YggS family pyridoxal phosphate enzyme [Microbispora bryophytorum]
MGDRREELAAALAEVERRVGDACRDAGRSRSEITLIAVTKTYPASDVRLLAELGVSHVGENRDQEAAAKAAECAGLGLTWHFIGQLQTNKVRSVASYAHMVHSVDRPRLVDVLGREAVRVGREVDCLIQVALDAAPGEGGAGRGGAAPQEVPALAGLVAKAEGLRLRGVMAVAPQGEDPAAAFARLRTVAERVREEHPAADVISAGMSGDIPQAVANGATHLRVGTALLGRRKPFVR